MCNIHCQNDDDSSSSIFADEIEEDGLNLTTICSSKDVVNTVWTYYIGFDNFLKTV